MAYRIRDWDRHFENSSSRKLKRLEWVAIPNKMDGEGYTALVDHPNAAAHLGAWYAIVEVASKQSPRGNLPGGICRDVGGICRSLSRISRLPPKVFEEVLPRLVQIGWVEEFQDSQDQSNQQNVRDLLAESANVAGESANVVGDSGRLVAAQGRELQGRELQGTTSTARPIDGNAEYPLVLAEIRKHDAAVDDFFARNLVQTVLQFALSNPKFPQAELDALTDVNIARCVKESYRTGPPNHGTGLLLKRVPSIALTWSLEN